MDKSIGYKEISVTRKGGETEIIPLKFGLFAVEQYCQITDTDFSDVPGHVMASIKRSPASTYANILLSGARCFEKIHGGEKDYTIKDAVSWVDSIGVFSGNLPEVFQEFLSSILPPQLEEDEEEEDEIDRAKKKQPKNSRSKK